MSAKFTPGPWRWDINPDSKSCLLESARRVVLGFERWGMFGAQPSFYVNGLLVPANELAVPILGREHHAHWCRTLTHPDAALIAAAPRMYDALLGVLRVADRATVEFDAARAAIAQAEGRA